MKISWVLAVFLLILLIVSNLAHGVECPPSSGVMGKDVANTAPDFFSQVLSELGIPYSDFAYNAFVYWAGQENTAAYWNPLATTWDMSPKSCTFNSAQVQNYVDEDTGITATSNTLEHSYGYYKPIVDMLNLKAFDEQKIRDAIRHWIGYSAYEDRLVKYWQDTYPNAEHQPPSTTTSPQQASQPTPVITLTLFVRDGSASGPIIPGATVTGNDGSDNSFRGTTSANGYVAITGSPGTWSFTASASGYADNSWNQQIIDTDSKDAFLEKQQPDHIDAAALVPPASDLGGINFTSIKLIYISVDEDNSGGINFDYLFKAHKAEGASPRIDPINSTLISANAFMTGLTVPNNKFWVNLDPWAPNRIIDKQLSQSEVGRILLEADLQMKRDFSNYDNPCANETGKALWNLMDKKQEALVQQCMDKFPGEIKNIDNVRFKPVIGHWIIPDKVYAFTKMTQIYIINATLKINSKLDADHSTFLVDNQDTGTLSKGCLEELNKSAKEYGEYWKDLEDRMMRPYVVADVNHGEKYEDLREVYIALAFAQWYKNCITSDMDVFRDSLDSSNSTALKSMKPWSPNETWDKYVYSFENGEYKCWENTTTENTTHTHTRLYSTGGVDFGDIIIGDNLVRIDELPPEVQDQVKRAVMDGFLDVGKDALFGKRFHVDLRQHTSVSSSGTHADPNLA